MSSSFAAQDKALANIGYNVLSAIARNGESSSESAKKTRAELKEVLVHIGDQMGMSLFTLSPYWPLFPLGALFPYSVAYSALSFILSPSFLFYLPYSFFQLLLFLCF